MYIMLFSPYYQNRIWGGQKLKSYFGKNIPNNRTGECWEVACHEHGHSIIKNGSLKEMSLVEAIDKYPKEILGYKKNVKEKFPLLLKLIDARDKLSVQVHPTDEYALKNEDGGTGKAECWYVIEAEENAKLIAGLKEGVTKKQFCEALKTEKLDEVLNEIYVKAGDVVNIPAGLIHAIGEGILLAEIQQNSDITYRVYDWGRVGTDGKKRDLHIKKSLEVIDFTGKISTEVVKGLSVKEQEAEHTYYIANSYFTLEKLYVTSKYEAHKSKYRFEIYICIEGQALIKCNENEVDIKSGDSFMIPACIMGFFIIGKACFIKTYIPEDRNLIIKGLKNDGYSMEQINKYTTIEIN